MLHSILIPQKWQIIMFYFRDCIDSWIILINGAWTFTLSMVDRNTIHNSRNSATSAWWWKSWGMCIYYWPDNIQIVRFEHFSHFTISDQTAACTAVVVVAVAQDTRMHVPPMQIEFRRPPRHKCVLARNSEEFVRLHLLLAWLLAALGRSACERVRVQRMAEAAARRNVVTPAPADLMF